MFSTTRSVQSIINDETFSDDLTNSNPNSSSSIVNRTLNVHYISQEYIFRKNSSQLPPTKMTENTKTEQPLKDLVKLTPRNIAIIELITSEQRFVHDMKNILKTYITPLLENRILSSSHIDALFLNWPSLTRTHEKLASALLTAFQREGDQISVGRILCDFIPELVSEYEIYFRFHPTAMKCFREQVNTSSKFRVFMQKTKEQSYGIGTMGDANILTLPLQRIAKYPFMIEQILKNSTPTCRDLCSLHRSQKEANELRETINNAIDEEINRVKFEWLQKHVDCSKINEIIVFNSLTHFGDQRKLIHYSHIHSKSTNHPFYAMLFNDFLLLTRMKRPLFTKLLQIIYQGKRNEIIDKTSTSQSNVDWFDSPEADHLYLIVSKKPIMLHEIRNVRLVDDDATGFQFDYRGRQMMFSTSSVNERLLWVKSINDAIDICRRRRLLISMVRAPESNIDSAVCRPVGKILIRGIHAMNLPLTSIQKNGNSPYCVIEMTHCQRQTTPVLCETTNLQWNVSFQFLVFDIHTDVMKCSIYNRSKYTTDRLLGSIEVSLGLLNERRIVHEDYSSIYSLATSDFSEMSSLNCQMRTFYLQHSSKNSQISLKYLLSLNE